MSIMARTSGEGAHPRVGGENKDALAAVKGTAGSSPRGRGKRQQDVTVQDLEGLIPAWAGKTSSVQAAAPPMRAHPRVGGENGDTSRPSRAAAGSSPRGRGKHCVQCRSGACDGLIPAWAGKTSGGESRQGTRGAHPRVGGENVITLSNSSHILGSSPRGRGKRSARCRVASSRGLIPAWAGKTPSNPRRRHL